MSLNVQKKLSICKLLNGTLPRTHWRPELCPSLFWKHWLRPTHAKDQANKLTVRTILLQCLATFPVTIKFFFRREIIMGPISRSVVFPDYCSCLHSSNIIFSCHSFSNKKLTTTQEIDMADLGHWCKRMHKVQYSLKTDNARPKN